MDIVDDDESLEEQETLTVSFATLPEGVEEGDDPTSTVSIVDDDNAGKYYRETVDLYFNCSCIHAWPVFVPW